MASKHITSIKVKDVKAGAVLPEPVYKHKPYVILDRNNVICHSGDLDIFASKSTYYDDCVADIRRYDLYLNDNTKVEAV